MGRDIEDEVKDEKNPRPLDEDDIALLKTYVSSTNSSKTLETPCFFAYLRFASSQSSIILVILVLSFLFFTLDFVFGGILCSLLVPPL